MRHSLFAFLLLAAAPASASVITLDSDADFQSYEASTPFTKFGSTTIQWGNAGPSGNWEYAVRGPSDGSTLGQGNVDWSSGAHDLAPAVQPFVGYTSTGGLSLAFNVVENGSNPNGNPTGNYATSGNVQAGANTLLVRAITTGSANPGAVKLSGITVSFGSGGFVDLGDVIGDADAAYVGLADARLASGFTLAFASGRFDWDASASNARPSLQVKLGQTPIADVPEPAALGLLGLGLIGVAAARRRRAA